MSEIDDRTRQSVAAAWGLPPQVGDSLRGDTLEALHGDARAMWEKIGGPASTVTGYPSMQSALYMMRQDQQRRLARIFDHHPPQAPE